MKYVHIDSVEQGQILGRSIFSSNGSTLLAAGVQLTVYMISTLKRVGVNMIFIKDVDFEDIEVEDVISEKTKQAVIRRMNESFQLLRSGKEMNLKDINQSVEGIMDDVMKNKGVLIQLADIRTKDTEMFVHAMNVCVLATAIGNQMGLNALQLKELAMGALLHDVGKVAKDCDDQTLDRKYHHTWKGFEILKKRSELSLLTAHIALQHHEKINGEGLPRGVKADQIHLYARIVCIANLYDNLLYGTSSERMLPHEACEHLMALSDKEIDREILIHFLKTVSIYPTGTSVRLSTHEMGVVVGQHRGLPGRPIVRVVNRDDSLNLMDIKEIDLAKHNTIFIDTVV